MPNAGMKPRLVSGGEEDLENNPILNKKMSELEVSRANEGSSEDDDDYTFESSYDEEEDPDQYGDEQDGTSVT